ncbi:MAG: hypothetical protein JW703_04770 [Candidatus Diapherotrites archaeon]|nr:hypothetical protein [Candidatus Diapherotrites archaeon]
MNPIRLHRTKKPNIPVELTERNTPVYFRNSKKDSRKKERFFKVKFKGAKIKIIFEVKFSSKYGDVIQLSAETEAGKKTAIGQFARKHHYIGTIEGTPFTGIKNLELSRYALMLLEEAELTSMHSKEGGSYSETKHKFRDIAQTPAQFALLKQSGYILSSPIKFREKRFREFLEELEKIKRKPENEINDYDKSMLQIEENLKKMYPLTPEKQLIKRINQEFENAFMTNLVHSNSSIDLLHAIFRKTNVAHDLWFTADFFKPVSNVRVFMEERKARERKRHADKSLFS